MPDKVTDAALPDVLTVEEYAALMRVSRNVAYDAVRKGTVESVRIGRMYRIPRRALAHILGQGRGARSV